MVLNLHPLLSLLLSPALNLAPRLRSMLYLYPLLSRLLSPALNLVPLLDPLLSAAVARALPGGGRLATNRALRDHQTLRRPRCRGGLALGRCTLRRDLAS